MGTCHQNAKRVQATRATPHLTRLGALPFHAGSSPAAPSAPHTPHFWESTEAGLAFGDSKTQPGFLTWMLKPLEAREFPCAGWLPPWTAPKGVTSPHKTVTKLYLLRPSWVWEGRWCKQPLPSIRLRFHSWKSLQETCGSKPSWHRTTTAGPCGGRFLWRVGRERLYRWVRRLGRDG